MASWVGSTVYPQVKIHSGASVSGCTACFVTALVIGMATLGSTMHQSTYSRHWCSRMHDCGSNALLE